MRGRREATALIAALVLGAVAAGPAGAAEQFYGVTRSDRLVTFQSDSPGAIRSSQAIRGLGGATLLAIDIRLATGQIYGLGSDDRLYRIDPRTARAARVGPPSTRQRSDAVGLDFNPTSDQLRVVNTAGQNARLDPDSGTLRDGDSRLAEAQPDAPLRYGANEPGSPRAPRVGATAYTTSSPGASAAQLFGIDQRRDTLVLQSPPNDGVLKTVGRLGVNADGSVGFDIARNGIAYAAFRRPGDRGARLYRIDLRSGRAARTARRSGIGTYRGRRRDPLVAIAAAGRVSADRTAPRVGIRKLSNTLISQLLRGRPLLLGVRCSEACTARATLRLGRRAVGGETGRVLGSAGRVTLRLGLSRRGRRIVRRARPDRLRVSLAASDAAGNSVRTRR